LRVLGVDPGLTRCGVGVVDGTPGRRCTLVHVDVVRTPADADLGDRLVAIQDAIAAAIAEYRPEVVAVERVFAQHNVRTVMGTAQAAALAIVAATRAGLPVGLHTPSEVKAAVTGSGVADKAQVGTMVTRILGLSQTPKPADAADALALAICHLWRAPAQARLAAAVAGSNAAAQIEAARRADAPARANAAARIDAALRVQAERAALAEARRQAAGGARRAGGGARQASGEPRRAAGGAERRRDAAGGAA
jgi:crossover junction endodeoxyribonuclease RuvC